ILWVGGGGAGVGRVWGVAVVPAAPGGLVPPLRALDWSGAAVIGYVAWVSTVFGFGAWGYLLRRYAASAVAPFSLLVPVFGMSSAALVLGEGISGLRWVAAALLVGGVALTSLAPGGAKPRTAVGAVVATGSTRATGPTGAPVGAAASPAPSG
ncbi:EamA family transporter, partial [Streptomyces sp. NPDC059411]|uniref:EamA family transporter n=1 Tax=Streptomyces sp. NPDC059411 TaxID=3346825 RepID=UPI0036A7757A